ncbi:MAG: hypothetical protein PVG39_04750 [Desulfobacteraceae bacterium]
MAEAVNNYPLLFYYNTYEASKLAVLHHAFLVLGNGMEWAYTQDKSKGGYVVDPKYTYDKTKDEYHRKFDPDYGTIVVKLDERLWKEDIYALTGPSAREEIFESDAKPYFSMPHVRKEGEHPKPEHTHYIYKITRESKVNPYPNFSKEFSKYWNIEPDMIQDDWRAEMIAQLKHWQTYFDDPERYKEYIYYKHVNAKNMKDWIESTGKTIEEVRSPDGYGFKDFNGSNYEALAEFARTRDIIKARDFIKETLQRMEG